MSIGKNIKKARQEADMTQEQLAELLNLSVSAVSRKRQTIRLEI